MKAYQAVYTKAGQTTCTVLAKDEKEAIEKLTEQLTRNPSRRTYFELWKENGFQVKEK